MQQVLQPAGVGGHYGAAVDVDGDQAVVGARLENQMGAAYVYLRTGGTWTLQQRLVASDPQLDGSYGSAVAVSGFLRVNMVNVLSLGCSGQITD